MSHTISGCWLTSVCGTAARLVDQYLALESLAGKLSSTASSCSSQFSVVSSWASSPALRTCTGDASGPGFLLSFIAAALSDLGLTSFPAASLSVASLAVSLRGVSVMADLRAVVTIEHARQHKGCRCFDKTASSGMSPL